MPIFNPAPQAATHADFRLATVQGVDMTDGADPTILYTVPAGKRCYAMFFVLRDASGSLVGGEEYTTNLPDSAWDFSGMTESGKFIPFFRSISDIGQLPVLEAGETIVLTVTAGATDPAYATIDVYGYCWDALSEYVYYVQGSMSLLVGDDGKTYKFMPLAEEGGAILLPAISTLSSGWHIHITSSAANNESCGPEGDVGVVKMNVGGTDYDYINVANEADLTVTYNGTKWIVTGTGATGLDLE